MFELSICHCIHRRLRWPGRKSKTNSISLHAVRDDHRLRRYLPKVDPAAPIASERGGDRRAASTWSSSKVIW